MQSQLEKNKFENHESPIEISLTLKQKINIVRVSRSFSVTIRVHAILWFQFDLSPPQPYYYDSCRITVYHQSPVPHHSLIRFLSSKSNGFVNQNRYHNRHLLVSRCPTRCCDCSSCVSLKQMPVTKNAQTHVPSEKVCILFLSVRRVSYDFLLHAALLR
jgi:hypothetical protein